MTAAFLWQDVTVHWSGIFTVLAAAAGGLMLCCLRLCRGRSVGVLGLFFPAAILFSLIFSRLCHWYCHPLQYDGFAAAMTDYAAGGFALPGAFAGVMLAAVLVGLCGLTDDLPGFLDELAPSGALALAVGRLGAAFDSSCRGSFLPEAAWLQQPPFSVPVSTAEGVITRHFATYLWQAAAAATLFAVCLVLLAAIRRPRGGHVFALFLCFYAAGQIVLDSTRYDAHFLRANGFVHLTQLCCLALLVGVFLLYAAAALRRQGFRRWMAVLWAAFAALGGLGGYMEYFVQRHGDRFALAYSVMAGCFWLMAALTCVLFRASHPDKEKRQDA